MNNNNNEDLDKQLKISPFDIAKFAVMEYKLNNIESYMNKMSESFEMLTKTVVAVETQIKENHKHDEWCRASKDELDKRVKGLEDFKIKVLTIGSVLMIPISILASLITKWIGGD